MISLRRQRLALLWTLMFLCSCLGTPSFGQGEGSGSSSTTREHRFEEAHVSISSSIAPRIEKKSVASENGHKADVIHLFMEFDYKVLVVGFITAGQSWPQDRSDYVLMQAAIRALEEANATPGQLVATTWRGRKSVESTGVAQSSDGEVYMSFRVVEDRLHNGVHVIGASTLVSTTQAAREREILEVQVQLLP
jgi:hypothetical protein